MRHEFVLIVALALFNATAFAQPAATEESTSYQAALGSVLKEELENSSDPVTQDFATFQVVSADQLFKQDAGFILSPEKPTVQPADPSPSPANEGFATSAGVLSAPGRFRVIDSATISEHTAPKGQHVSSSTSTLKKNAFAIRQIYSTRRIFKQVEPLPTDYDKVYASWYQSQVPTELVPGTPGAPTKFRVLYLSECWADDVPPSLEEAMGGKSIDAKDRPVLDRARIEVALAREGIDFVVTSPFDRRMSSTQRETPDSSIRNLNVELWQRHRSGELAQPTLVLEKYCGKKLTAIAAYMTSGSKFYRIAVPDGLTGVYYAPLFFAQVCQQKTGSRYVDKSCKKWEPVQSNDVLSGLGGYRLVGKREDAVVSYRYEIRSTDSAGSQDQAKTVNPSLEP